MSRSAGCDPSARFGSAFTNSTTRSRAFSRPPGNSRLTSITTSCVATFLALSLGDEVVQQGNGDDRPIERARREARLFRRAIVGELFRFALFPSGARRCFFAALAVLRRFGERPSFGIQSSGNA